MADEEDAEKTEATEGEATEESPKVGGKRKLIIIVAAVVLLLGGAGGAYFMGLFGGGGEKAETEEVAEGEEGADTAKKGKPVYVELPEFLVNLNTNKAEASFIKMTVTLEVDSPSEVQAIETYKPRIIDTFNSYLRELRPSDLSGSVGLYRLREELLLRVNAIVAPAQVDYINFTQILVQ